MPKPTRVEPCRSTIKKIVVVEDLLDARTMLATLLRLRGFDVTTAGCGQSGLDLIRDERPDIALVDIGLPEIDGYEVAQRLRADPTTEQLYLIALTGYGQANDRDQVRKAGFDDHLVKPLNLDELQVLLNRR